MENKTYIGLTPTKEMEEVKSKLESSTGKRMLYQPSTIFYTIYRDANKIAQFRIELWKEVEENILEIIQIVYVKDGLREGEEINLEPKFD